MRHGAVGTEGLERTPANRIPNAVAWPLAHIPFVPAATPHERVAAGAGNTRQTFPDLALGCRVLSRINPLCS